MNDWFRSWHGAPTDSKWIAIARRIGVAPAIVSAVAWALFDHASQASHRGTVSNFDFETYADVMEVPEETIRAIYAGMESKGIITDGRLAKWDKRQPRREDPGAGERGRASRERRRASLQQVSTEERQIVEDAPMESASTPSARPIEEAAPISQQAMRLADEIAHIAGHHDLSAVPPSWCGAALRVQMWLGRGWQPQLIIESVRARMARRDATGPPPATIQYFEGCIADAHVALSRPVRSPPSQHHRQNTPPQKTIMGVIDGMLDDIKRGGDRGGENPSRMLPDRRGERS